MLLDSHFLTSHLNAKLSKMSTFLKLKAMKSRKKLTAYILLFWVVECISEPCI